MLHEKVLRRQYQDIVTTLTAAFPGVPPVESVWILSWIDKYPFPDIVAAIQTLHDHSLKSKFTQQSIGRAISAMLRDAAMKRLTDSLSAGGVKS
jgi:hypothetical protein